MASKKGNFEESLSELEKIVKMLEKGELSLDESLEKFEVGLKLYKECKDKLSIAEKKITVLSHSLKEEDI